jgi:cytochrome c oxidase subunit II
MNTRSDYGSLFDVYWPIGVGVFVVVFLLVVIFVLRFRSRSDEIPRGRDESMPLELTYAGLLVAVAALLLYFTFSHNDELQADFHRPARWKVDVTASRWEWRFVYPGSGAAVQGTGSRIPTLYVPAGEAVDFRGTSLDVQHAFWVPAERFKRDVFPERTTSWQMTFDSPGFHEAAGACAEFCGLRHSNMEFNVDVLPPKLFESWLRRAGGGR